MADESVRLAALLDAQARVDELPLEAIPALLAQVSAEQARLAAVQGALAARLVAAPPATNGRPAGRRLTVNEAAARTGMSADWLYRHARQLPFARRIGRAVRFDEAELERWLATRRPG